LVAVTYVAAVGLPGGHPWAVITGASHGAVNADFEAYIAARHPFAQSSVLEEVQPVIDGLAEQAALISKDGTILAINRHWRRQVERQQQSGLLIDRDYDAYLAGLVAQGDEGVRPILQAFRDICAGTRNNFSCLYRGYGVFSGYDFKVVITAMEVHAERFILATVHDVTELASLKRQRRRLGSQLLRAQENERRRMARDLHDSTSQALVALQLSLHKLSKEYPSASGEALVAECQEAIQEVHREIRALSFIAHPPSFAAAGLEPSLESMVAGFARRTGIEVRMECDGVEGLSGSVEATIFRLAQEALANIHRHSSARHATVRLIGREGYVHLLVWDDGVGFEWSPKKRRLGLGVGVLGMAERVRELGGRLSLKRLAKGTLLRATLPRLKCNAAA
jgi:signal transduction histidine kinase